MFDGLGDDHLGELTPKACQAAYDRLRAAGRSVDTHRNTLAVSKSFLGWCRAKGWAEANAMEGVTGEGRRRRGKAQLRIDESRKLLDLALELGAAGDASAVAVATVLLMGIRASECAWIQARDVDDGGRLLWIPRSKTEAGVRRLEVPEVLRPLLKGIGPQVGPLFPDRDRHWVLYHVRRLCRLAGVPEVTTHGLRGTQSTISRAGGASAEVVAAQLGHASTGVQDRHYVQPDAAADARNRAALNVLRGGRP
jgi:integrase